MDGEGLKIKGFIEASFLDWPGKIASVVFLPGCNFRCPFCHNGPLVKNPEGLEDFPLEEILYSLRENEGWVDGVVITGGEPTIQEGLPMLISLIREQGLPVRLDTNGYRPDVLRKLIKQGLIDGVAMDIKAGLTPGAYARAAGAPVDISVIRESINIISDSGLEAVFRTTVVPGLHDYESVLSIAEEIKGHTLILRNFNPAEALDPEFREIKPFEPRELRAMQAAVEPVLGKPN